MRRSPDDAKLGSPGGLAVRYFAYGSNMDPQQMGERAPSARVVGVGRLDGYRLVFNVYSTGWEGGAANLEPDPDAHVWGVVWEVSEEELERLDTYEGHPTFYRREEVTVQTPGGPETCLTYRVAHQKGFVRPTDGYYHLLASAIRVQGLPVEALDMLEHPARPPTPTIST